MNLWFPENLPEIISFGRIFIYQDEFISWKVKYAPSTPLPAKGTALNPSHSCSGTNCVDTYFSQSGMDLRSKNGYLIFSFSLLLSNNPDQALISGRKVWKTYSTEWEPQLSSISYITLSLLRPLQYLKASAIQKHLYWNVHVERHLRTQEEHVCIIKAAIAVHKDL